MARSQSGKKKASRQTLKHSSSERVVHQSLIGAALTYWMEFWFGNADARAYGLFRILFSIVSLINLIDVWPYRHALLSSDGMIDRETLLKAIGEEPYYSLFFWLDSQLDVTLICVAAGLAMLMLGLGIFPRLAALAVFVWHLSFSHAAFPSLVGWDNLLRVYSFLLLISPLGEVWSLPAWRQRNQQKDMLPKQFFAPRYGLLLMRLQLVLVYFATFWAKVDDPYWRSGQLISYFQMSIYARWPDPVWADRLLLSCLLSYGTLIVELAIPVLLLIRSTRWLGFILGFGLHLGIAISSNLAMFSWVILATYAAFLETPDIERITKYFVPCWNRFFGDKANI